MRYLLLAALLCSGCHRERLPAITQPSRFQVVVDAQASAYYALLITDTKTGREYLALTGTGIIALDPPKVQSAPVFSTLEYIER